MTGLRERKKQEVRHRIVRAAAGRFAAAGLDATTMEDIASAAEVSVATVYNYFGSKNALLLAGVSEDTDTMVERGATVLARPGAHPAKAVARLFDIYLDEFLGWDPALLREVMSASFGRVNDHELTAELVHMDERLIAQLAELLAGFKQKGRLHPDVEPGEATLLLFSALVTQLFMYLAMDGVAEAAVRNQVRRQVAIAFGGLAFPDHEKVT